MDTTDRSIEAPTTQNAITETMQRRDIYPKWPWSWPIRFTRILFTELIMQPLVWLLATPQVECETELTQNKPILIIANHVSTYDVPLVLYALPGKLRRRISPAMAADMLYDWRRMRNLGPHFLNFLGPAAYLLITALFNAFPLRELLASAVASSTRAKRSITATTCSSSLRAPLCRRPATFSSWYWDSGT